MMLFPSVSLLLLSAPAIAAAALGSHLQQLQQPLTEGTSQFSKIPSLGFGTWNLDKTNVSEAVSAALHTGYRHVDCAAIYGNQKAVGKGIAHGLKSLNLDRSDIWVTSKLWNDQYSPNCLSLTSRHAKLTAQAMTLAWSRRP